jgi:hypothetical protein
VVSIEHADFDGIERIAAVTGGEIASTFDRPELVALGECALIDEIMVRARIKTMSLPASFRLPLGGTLYRRHPTLHVFDHASDVSLAPLSILSLSRVVLCAGGRGPADPVQRVQERQRLLHHPPRRLLAPPRRGRYAPIPSFT